jgi:hypothetical protein
MRDLQRLLHPVHEKLDSLTAKVDKIQSTVEHTPPVNPSSIFKFLSNPFTQVVLVLIPLAVAFSGKFDTTGTEVAIVIALVIGGVGIYSHLSKTIKLKIFAAILILVYGAGLWKLNNYLITKAGPLTKQQKDDFTAILKTVFSPPDYVEIVCPEADEPTCIYAATFIPLFQRAGWKVGGPEGPRVERVKLATPTASILLVALGPAKPSNDIQNPDVGVWTRENPWSQTLTTAFTFILHAPIEQQNDPTMKLNRIKIYFGSIPKL